MTHGPDDLLSPQEVSFLLHVSTRTVARWADEGILPVAGWTDAPLVPQHRFRRSDVDHLLEGNGAA